MGTHEAEELRAALAAECWLLESLALVLEGLTEIGPYTSAAMLADLSDELARCQRAAGEAALARDLLVLDEVAEDRPLQARVWLEHRGERETLQRRVLAARQQASAHLRALEPEAPEVARSGLAAQVERLGVPGGDDGPSRRTLAS